MEFIEQINDFFKELRHLIWFLKHQIKLIGAPDAQQLWKDYVI
jgi:hypothetical protein